MIFKSSTQLTAKKNAFLLLSLILFIHTTFAQVRIVNHLLKDKNSDVLYIGDFNRIEIEGADDHSSITLKAGNAEIRNHRGHTFEVYTTTPGIDTLFVYKKKKLLVSKVYRVERICNPIVRLGDDTSTFLTIPQILANPEFIVRSECEYDVHAGVRHFGCTIISAENNKLYSSPRKEGWTLEEEELKIIATLKSGSKIIIDDIVAVGASFCPRSIQPLVIEIK